MICTAWLVIIAFPGIGISNTCPFLRKCFLSSLQTRTLNSDDVVANVWAFVGDEIVRENSILHRIRKLIGAIQLKRADGSSHRHRDDLIATDSKQSLCIAIRQRLCVHYLPNSHARKIQRPITSADMFSTITSDICPTIVGIVISATRLATLNQISQRTAHNTSCDRLQIHYNTDFTFSALHPTKTRASQMSRLQL
nr:hypothetical protein BN444_04117 [Xanthomonas translucens pv. translucens DSM 18974]